MNTISITYTIKYVVSFAPNYVFTEHDECFNSKTGRRIKQVYNNGSIGYNICGKFYSVSKLRKYLVKPNKETTPF